VVPGPTACLCCGGGRLRKLGETVTETLEVIPRQWKVIQHVREKFTCRDCEKISEAPAPFHVVRGSHCGRRSAQFRHRMAKRCFACGAPAALFRIAAQCISAVDQALSYLLYTATARGSGRADA
jgi:transposase